MVIAFTRAVAPSMARCELTHLQREPIDYARAVAQHDAYEAALRRAGCRVQRLPSEPELPDAVFVEDTAVVFDDIAVIARPGAASRRPEVASMAAALQPHRRLVYIQSPGTLDGGDVLAAAGRVFVGISGRTNADGARQLAGHVAPFGFTTVPVAVTGCLHLKTAVTWVGASVGSAGALLVNPAWVDPRVFDGFDLIEIDPEEPMSANVLAIDDRVICAEEYLGTRRRLEAHGFVTQSVPASELAKAEAGVTCCSVLVQTA